MKTWQEHLSPNKVILSVQIDDDVPTQHTTRPGLTSPLLLPS